MGLDSDGSIFRLDLNYALINTVTDETRVTACSLQCPRVPGELVISISAAAGHGHNQSQQSNNGVFAVQTCELLN